MNRQNANEHLLNSREFSELPHKLREWILESPNATANFAEFFDNGGKFDPRPNVKLPYYSPENPPKIVVNQSDWEALRQKDAPESLQRHLFGTLAHEIGHDRFNTATVLFTGATAEQYVQYRSELEAHAIFNAFPIFKDLEQHPDFKQSFPLNDIGYLNGAELAQIYKQWDGRQLTEEAAVSWMASKVADTPYTLSDPPQDMDQDRRLTHRDKYLQDFEQYMKPRLALQTMPDAPARFDERITYSMSPVLQAYGVQTQEFRFFPRTPEDDYVDAYLDAMDGGDYAARRALTEQYEQMPHVRALQQEAREALLAEQQRILEEQLRQEQERQRLQQQMQQEQEHSRGRGFSR